MTFDLDRHGCSITKEPSDKRFRSESDVFYRLRNLMRAEGWDVGQTEHGAGRLDDGR